MEEDFAVFLLMIVLWCFPFAFIYFLLNLLNWNERKNLFLDSWFVYLAWLVSSLFTLSVHVLIDHNLVRNRSGFIFYLIFAFSMIFINTIVIAGVLYLRSREKKSFDITNYVDEKIQTPSIKKIWQTSAIVSISTLMMIVSLFLAVADISEKWEKQKNPNKNSYGIYDL